MKVTLPAPFGAVSDFLAWREGVDVPSIGGARPMRVATGIETIDSVYLARRGE